MAIKTSSPKRKMQNVDFNSVEEFLDFLPKEELQITLHLRSLIFETVPDVYEKLSFNVPFYSRRKGLFFIWPASILWGSKKSYTGVRLGFQQGYLLQDDLNYLEKGSRKQVYMKDFQNLAEIDDQLLAVYFYEALEIDKTFKKGKR